MLSGMDAIAARIRTSVLFFSSGTLLSRCSGLLRDLVTAYIFGGSAELALFLIAFRLANACRRLFAETPMTASVMPQIAATSEQKRLFCRLSVAVFVCIGCLVALCEGALYCGMALVSSSDWLMIMRLIAQLFPSLILLVGIGLNSAFLQAKHKMFISSISSIWFNIGWIAGALLSGGSIHMLTVGVLLGFTVQYLFTLSAVVRAYCITASDFSTAFVSPLKAIAPTFILSLSGIAATQINNAIDPFFATCSMLEAPAYLWYAIRLYQLPLSFFGVALAAASFPELARAFQERPRSEYGALVRRGVRLLCALFAPLSIALFIGGGTLVTLVYQRGQFTSEDAQWTTLCLRAYLLGLLPAALTLFASNALYAQGRYRLPALAAALSVVCNIAANATFIFVFRWGPESVALATSMSAWVNAGILMAGMKESAETADSKRV